MWIDPRDKAIAAHFQRIDNSIEISDLDERVTGTFNSDGTLNLDPQAGLAAGYIWVHHPDQRSAVPAVVGDRMFSSRRTAGKRCQCGFNPKGELVAVAPINDQQSAGANEQAAYAQQLNTPLPASNLTGGRVLASPTGGLNVFVEAYPPAGWTGGDILIDSGDVPTNANEFRWAVFYFPAYTGTPVVPTYALTTAVTKANKEALLLSDARDLSLPARSIRLFAVSLTYQETVITGGASGTSRFEDLRDLLTPDIGSISTPDATDVTYTPSTSGDWPVVPTDVQEALDDLAAGTAALGVIHVSNYADARPSPAADGDTVVLKDGLWWEVYHDGIWNPYKDHVLLTAPPLTGWTDINSPTVDASYGAINLIAPATSTANKIVGRVRTPANSTYVLTAGFQLRAGGLFPFAGLCWSDGTKFALNSFGYVAGFFNRRSYKFTDSTTGSAAYVDATDITVPGGAIFWLRCEDNGTNRICSFSADGKYWEVLHTVSRTDFLTPTQIGFFACAGSGNVFQAAMTLLSWKET